MPILALLPGTSPRHIIRGAVESGATRMHSDTRVPVDDQYAAAVGKAVYVFAYYEWSIIWVLECMDPGFVHRYARGTALTSGQVHQELERQVHRLGADYSGVLKLQLQELCEVFGDCVRLRNALIHAHPSTAPDGAQILMYQTDTSKALHDVKWPINEVMTAISWFDKAAGDVSPILEKLLSRRMPAA
jgi:hypothetical protein